MRRTHLLIVTVALLTLTAVARPAPADARRFGGAALTGVTTVRTGLHHSCALLTNREVRCWGRNDVGQLGGNDTSTSPQPPLAVLNVAGTAPLSGVAGIATGTAHSCAVLVNRQVRCWGSGELGQLGDGDHDDAHRPVVVLNASGTGPLSGAVGISASGRTTCARLIDGQARCWGDDTYGQLGNGAPDASQPLPVPVRAVAGSGNLRDVTQLDVGEFDTCARLANGQARCWGDNFAGQLGDGTFAASSRPVVVTNASGTGPLTTARRVSIGRQHACAVRTDGTARCWGRNSSGQLGTGDQTPSPRPVGVVNRGGTLLTGIADVHAADAHTCALLTNGQVRCWAFNEDGQLGLGVASEPRLRPVAVRNGNDTDVLRGVSQLHAGASHTCVRLINGQARCWGYNRHGAVGDRSTFDAVLPVQVVFAGS